MKLKSFNYLYCLLIIFLYFTPLKSEDKINIWQNKGQTQPKEDKEIISDLKRWTRRQLCHAGCLIHLSLDRRNLFTFLLFRRRLLGHAFRSSLQ